MNSNPLHDIAEEVWLQILDWILLEKDNFCILLNFQQVCKRLQQLVQIKFQQVQKLQLGGYFRQPRYQFTNEYKYQFDSLKLVIRNHL